MVSSEFSSRTKDARERRHSMPPMPRGRLVMCGRMLRTDRQGS